MITAGELKVADIAKLHDVDRKTAYRWLVAIEKRYGAKVVGRRGKRGVLFTTARAFGQVAPLVADALTDPAALQRRIAELEERVGEQDQQIAAMQQQQRDFRAKSSAWFSRKI